MTTPHNAAKPGDIAKTVLMPGSAEGKVRGGDLP